jgi:hypothetical protein
MRPKAAATAVSARSTGTSAATTEPNAKRSTSRVTGIDSSSARWRSRSTIRSRASLAEMSPVSSTSMALVPVDSIERRNASPSYRRTNPVTSAA